MFVENFRCGSTKSLEKFRLCELSVLELGEVVANSCENHCECVERGTDRIDYMSKV